MNILVLYAHPVETSFNAGLHRMAINHQRAHQKASMLTATLAMKALRVSSVDRFIE
jgi:putative NADPH-quinone reductase